MSKYVIWRCILGILLFILVTSFPSAAQSLKDRYLQIQNLSNDDPIFVQVLSDIRSAFKAQKDPSLWPALVLVRYTCKENENLYTISARLNLSYSSLASLNRLSNPEDLYPGKEIFIPNLPGLHLFTKPETQLEELIFQRLQNSPGYRYKQNPEETADFIFIANSDFSSDERLMFLGKLFQSPLEKWRLSSPFGFRINPFTHTRIHHDGIDMVAPYKSSVRAARSGTVISTGFDAVYGNFIIIEHAASYTTMYAHLAQIKVKKGDAVKSGSEIGYLGNTGQSTAAHLHFEIRYKGKAQDPLKYL